MMKGNKILYAALGAPVLATRTMAEKAKQLRASLSKEADTISRTAGRRLEAWAMEGEKVASRITEGKMVDELAAKVDFDQVSEQVSKLRDQLEGLLATWRASFRPETAKAPATRPEPVQSASIPAKAPAQARGSEAGSAKAPAKKAATKKAATKKAPAKPAAKKTAAAKKAS
jgi:hypothetical protein